MGSGARLPRFLMSAGAPLTGSGGSLPAAGGTLSERRAMAPDAIRSGPR